MGACLSSKITDKSNCAFVVTMEGELIQYPTPIFVSEVVQPGSFVCNSDNLYYDCPIISLDPEDQLEAGQIYFILHKTMLDRRLSTKDMATLAIKASRALDSKSNKNKARILPLETSQIDEIDNVHKQQRQKLHGGLRVSRCGSIRKYSSKKARVASIRLSTIYENEGCEVN